MYIFLKPVGEEVHVYQDRLYRGISLGCAPSDVARAVVAVPRRESLAHSFCDLRISIPVFGIEENMSGSIPCYIEW